MKIVYGLHRPPRRSAAATCSLLIMYVSKMVPTSDYSRFYAFGRVFSGRGVERESRRES